jgi:hypothetical protein
VDDWKLDSLLLRSLAFIASFCSVFLQRIAQIAEFLFHLGELDGPFLIGFLGGTSTLCQLACIKDLRQN